MSEIHTNAKALDAMEHLVPAAAPGIALETRPGAESRSWQLIRTILSFPAMLGTMLMGAAFVVGRAFDINPDFWWHAKVGEMILATHHWPIGDPFSFTAAGRPWLAYEWLGDVLFAGVARLAGLQGLDALLIVLGAAILLALYGYATLRCGNSKAGFAAAAALMVLAAPAFTLRPQMLGFLFLIATLAILERFRQGKTGALWCLPPLFLLWINTHGSWVIGVGTIALVSICGFVRLQIGDVRSEPFTRGQSARLGVVLVMCLMAIPVTPYGLKLAAYPFEVASALPLNFANVSEWRSMPFNELTGKVFLALVLGSLICRSAMRLRWRLDEFLLFLAGTVMACMHVRFLLLFVPFVTPVFAEVLARWIPAYDRKQDHVVLNGAIMAAGVALMIVYFPTQKSLEQVVARNSPVSAVEYLRSHPVPGPLFATYEFGDYLVWSMAPEHRVFIDGRGELYEREGVLADYLKIAGVRPSAIGLLRAHGIESCLIRRNEPLITLLSALPEWRQTYSDDLSVLFVRTEKANAAGSPEAVGE
jgi:hypothetical protein